MNKAYGNELWYSTHEWLKHSGTKVRKSYCQEKIAGHPDYPGLTSVIDFLDSLKISFRAVHADQSYISKLNYPILAHIRSTGSEYFKVITEDQQKILQDELKDKWTGTVLFFTGKTIVENENYNRYLQTIASKTVLRSVILLSPVILYLISAFMFSKFNHSLFGLASLLGILTTILLVGKETGFKSKLADNFCGVAKQGACEDVLLSKYSQVFKGISISDIALCYFIGQFITWIVSFWHPIFFSVLFFCSFIGLAVSAWSIYTQAILIRNWCPLCLVVVFVLVTQNLILSFAFTSEIKIQPNYSTLLFIPLILTIGIPFKALKTFLTTCIVNQQKAVLLDSWKSDAFLFAQLLKKSPLVDTKIWDNDFLLGSANAPILLTIACNVYCKPCSILFTKIRDWLYRFPDIIQVQMRFLCDPNTAADERTIAVEAILAEAAAYTDRTTKLQLISDWYEAMSLDNWEKKWKSGASYDINLARINHNQWIRTHQREIKQTPTVFINGRKLPQQYLLIDLEHLIPKLQYEI